MTDPAVRFDAVLPAGPVHWSEPVTFVVQRGEMALVAALPAAATTVVRLVVGSRAPASGRVFVLGTQPSDLKRRQRRRFRRRLGVAFHEPEGLVSNLDLEMNLVVPQIYSGLRGLGAAQQATDEIVEQLDLADWRTARPADMPPEVRREAVVARALVRTPELLVLEEPTDGLDNDRARRLLGLCREHAGTILITSSEKDDPVFRIVDRTIVIDGDDHGMGVV